MENEVKTLRHQLQQIVFKQASEQTKNPYSREVFKQLTNCHTATQGVAPLAL
jgi:hypothetical protein